VEVTRIDYLHGHHWTGQSSAEELQIVLNSLLFSNVLQNAGYPVNSGWTFNGENRKRRNLFRQSPGSGIAFQIHHVATEGLIQLRFTVVSKTESP